MLIKEGEKLKLEFKFSQDQVNTYIDITGDNNPVHYDVEYAEKSIFKKPVIHGILTASVFSKIFGTIFPGPGTIYLTQNLKFLKPMYVGESYTAIVEIIELMPEKHRCRFSTIALNENSEETIRGDALLFNDKVF